MNNVVREIDLHVLVLLLPLAALMLAVGVPWLLFFVAGVPQGRTLARAFWDYPRFERPATAYLLANEGLVAIAVAACSACWFFFQRSC